MNRGLKRLSLLAVCLWIFSSLLLAGTNESKHYTLPDSDSSYELTIFVIPSYRPIDWSSPEKLLRTTVHSFIEASFNRNLYPIGHLFIELRDHNGNVRIRTSIASSEPSEQRRMILKDKIGLAMLGASVKGRMESVEELEKKINRFARREAISFINYKITPSAAERVIEYVYQFTSQDSLGNRASDRYSGSFWPRYKGEGAGCSAFGIAALELIGAEIDNPEWYVKVKVPYDLIGGVYNNQLKVSPADILKRRKWHDGSGEEGVDYYIHFIYEPSYIYEWILKQVNGNNLPEGFLQSTILAPNGRKIRGLFFDATKFRTPDDSIFKERERSCVFINN